jgi:hypothetical protein
MITMPVELLTHICIFMSAAEIMVFIEHYDILYLPLVFTRKQFSHVKSCTSSKLSPVTIELSKIGLVTLLVSNNIEVDYQGCNIRCAKNDLDVGLLACAHTLNLSHTGVTDSSTLGKVHTLNLADTAISNVSTLGDVHTLTLYGTKVTDVSALGKVHTLDLWGTKVANVDALGNVHTLN